MKFAIRNPKSEMEGPYLSNRCVMITQSFSMRKGIFIDFCQVSE